MKKIWCLLTIFILILSTTCRDTSLSDDNRLAPEYMQLRQTRKANGPRDITSHDSGEPNMIQDSSGLQVNPKGPLFIFMCIVYVISTVSAVITNLIVILVYLLGRRVKTDLSVFLLNLAIADFLMSTVCMPFSFAQALLKEWIFGDILCPIVLFMQVLTVSLSIYTMVAIGIDRYYAIKCPFQSRVTHKKARFVMLTVWLLSISLASVQLFVAGTGDNEDRNNFLLDKNKSISSSFTLSSSSFYTTTSRSYMLDNNLTSWLSSVAQPIANQNVTFTVRKKTCNEIWKNENHAKIYTVFSLMTTYLIPVFILAYTYSCIACIIRQTTHPGNADPYRDMHSTKSKKKVVKMLILLVCVFTLCWLPLHLFTLISHFTEALDIPESIWYFYSAHWLAMANCTINPIIYGYSSKSFRSDVYALIICCKCFSRREWIRHESSKTTSLLLKRVPKANNCHNRSNKNANLITNQNRLKNPAHKHAHVINRQLYGPKTAKSARV